ncbi:GNAT family N-acetyltransferase [Proteus terrae]|uniref:Butyryltransferase n=1 Tax=Proteus vulgaris TaxID=585 RepID=A0A385JMY3_PROVU|nr:GNAT family N-acetyltransferase [Proteus terrae]AXY99710.1 butyryltransferase [Proteus vulgaris]QKD71056.1 GNAT family N-acetyltransferase [Proteus terrae subsp. cibarius]QKD72883.1 GNAT family N-acetyltransferase [Proteus terrae subsp. cibarius]UDF26032.1 GNAT family N-acetyltransferase [Proteus terrae subsp. cibarius]WCG86961.1 GNAT family N-acetyltransferase [Proteus terrae]
MILTSKTIKLRLVNEDDAEFILSLRTNSTYNRFLSPVNNDIKKQKEWIKFYKKKEKNNEEFYFIIEKLDNTPCGTVRIYDIHANSFSWGSWILNKNKTRTAAVESALLVYIFGFERKKFSRCHFEVMKGNEKVISFHEKFNATRVNEDENHYFYEIEPKNIIDIKNKFINFIK